MHSYIKIFKIILIMRLKYLTITILLMDLITIKMSEPMDSEEVEGPIRAFGGFEEKMSERMDEDGEEEVGAWVRVQCETSEGMDQDGDLEPKQKEGRKQHKLNIGS